MKMSKLSNQTNSQDPQAVNSRVFVGNLNTFQCSKTDVERMFQKYGRLVGISMHKGYAFVQFTNPFDARNACHGEDGRTILSQVLGEPHLYVNMVAEPKPHQTGRKRQNINKTGNDWDYYYDSYYASTLFAPTPTRPSKRQRLMAPQNRLALANNKLNSTLATTLPQTQLQQQQQQFQQQQQSLQLQQLQQQQLQLANIVYPTSPSSVTSNCNNSISLCNGGATVNGEVNGTQYTNGQHANGPFKTYSNPDTLICGNCRELFTDLAELLDHKKAYCKLRFTCKCQESASSPSSLANKYPSAKLLCVVCKESFANPWDLMVHAQAAHMINIYEIGDSDDEKTDTDVSDDVSSINNDGVIGMHMNGGGEQIDKINENGTTPAPQEDSTAKNDETHLSNMEYAAFESLVHDDVTKINGNGHDAMSLEETSGEESNNVSPRTCIMSIEATTAEVPTALRMVSSSPLSISIGSGTITTK